MFSRCDPAGQENMELTLGELQEMAARQQHQIEMNNQILQAREQRLKHLRQQQQCMNENLSDAMNGQCNISDVGIMNNQLRSLRKIIYDYKLEHPGAGSDLDVLRKLCAEKEQELRLATERVEDLNRQIEHFRRMRQTVKSPEGEQLNRLCNDSQQTELDRLRQELVIRNRLNEQQAEKIAAQKELFDRKQKELLSIDSRLLQLTEHLCSRKFVAPKFTDIVYASGADACSPIAFDCDGVQKSPKITFANCGKDRQSPVLINSSLNDDAHCCSVPNLRIDDDKLHMHLNVMNTVKKRHSITESEGSGYTHIPISLLRSKPEVVQDSPQTPKSSLTPTIKPADTEESSKSRRSAKKVRFDPIAILLDAAVEGELDLVMEAVKQLQDPSQPNDEGITALHNAVCAGNFHCVEYLVKCGCDVNFADNDGWTPLHCAASCNNLTMIKFLVEHGASIFAQTSNDAEIPEEKCEPDQEGYDECLEYLTKIRDQLGSINNGIVYALYELTPSNPDELELKVGQKLKIVRKGDSQEREWWWAEDCETEQHGYVPRNYVGLYPRYQAPCAVNTCENQA